VAATHVIRQIRSYEFDAPPRMRAGVCEYCAAPIFRRRAEAQQKVRGLSDADSFDRMRSASRHGSGRRAFPFPPNLSVAA
jgi:hypothetical protein